MTATCTATLFAPAREGGWNFIGQNFIGHWSLLGRFHAFFANVMSAVTVRRVSARALDVLLTVYERRCVMPRARRRNSDLTSLHSISNTDNQETESKIWEEVYEDLSQLARRLRHRTSYPAIDGTGTLVHEAYLRLAKSKPRWRCGEHFYAIAARTIRFVLADQARHRLAAKRDVALVHEIPEEIIDTKHGSPEEIVAIHEVLDRLGAISPRQVEIIELSYFAGLPLNEVATTLELSSRTVARDWKKAREWLSNELRSSNSKNCDGVE